MRRDVFQAIADPTRRDIVSLVAFNKLNLNAIAKNFDMSRPAISQHIKILEQCGLVSISQLGRERFCEVQPERLAQLSDWLAPFNPLFQKTEAPKPKPVSPPKKKEVLPGQSTQISMF
jgi:DNA-binding transcriptional ArsR family regulator